MTMNQPGFVFTCSEHTITGAVDAPSGSLVLTFRYADGTVVSGQLQDSLTNPDGPGRTNLRAQPGQWAFFSQDTIITTVSEDPAHPSVRLTTPLHRLVAQRPPRVDWPRLSADALRDHSEAAPLQVCYQFDYYPELASFQVRSWFDCFGPVPAHSVRWLDFRFDALPLTRFYGGLPDWHGRVHAMPEPLGFYDAVMLHDGKNGLSVCNTGRILLAGDQNGARLAAFADLLAYQDDLTRLNAATPLSAWVSLDPWQDGAQLLRLRDRLAARPAPVLTQQQAIVPDEKISFASGRLKIELLKSAHGLVLASLTGGVPIYTGQAPEPLFSLKLLDLRSGLETMLSSADGWDAVQVKALPDRLECCLSRPWLDHHPIEPFSVQITALARPALDRIEWQVTVLNQHPGISVLACDYPNLCFNDGRWDALTPKASGVLCRDACNHAGHLAAIYPAYTLAMQYYAIYRPDAADGNGLYLGIHDVEACRKDFFYTTLPGSQFGHIRFEYPAEGLGLGANSFQLPGPLVWQVFSGDWYDATTIYRGFVHSRANYLPDETRQGRPDSPDWFRELPFWIMDWLPNGNPDKEPIPVSIRPETPPGPRDWIDLPIRLREALGVPIGYHVYNWHWIPFNNDFPHYFPLEEGFAEGVGELQSAGVQVMPYINGRLWDLLDRRDEDYRFSREALPHATKHLDGSVMHESYASHEPDGRLCKLAAMCPSSWFWQQELERITQRLFHEVGVKAIYIDQVAAASQNLCCDPTHNHLPGGGSWWNKSYQRMMDRLNQVKPDDRAFTTECNAEPYAGSFDGYLTWQWIEGDQVPAFPQVYAGRVAMLGRNINGYKKKDVPYCKFHIAEQVLFGQQIGWINADIVDDARKFPFLKKMVRLRYQYRDLFAAGHLLRPPQVTSDLPELASFYGMGRPLFWPVFSLPRVVAGHWRHLDGRSVLFVINTADQAAVCSISLAGPELPAVTTDYQLKYYESGSAGAKPHLQQQPDGLNLQVTLAPEGMMVLEWPHQ
jgi:hypothetical protein